MKNKLFILVLLMVASNIFGAGSRESRHLENISNIVSSDIQKTSLNKGDLLAIVAINNTTENTASNIISSLETAIIRSNYVKLISRRHISEAMNEIELGFSGYIDDSSATRLGHFLGVGYIMVGSITNNILTFQILEVETLHIVYSERFDVSFFNDSAKSRGFRF
jgi:TolB-like protein